MAFIDFTLEMFEECTESTPDSGLKLNRHGKKRVVQAGMFSGLACDLLVMLPYALNAEAQDKASGGRYIAGESIGIAVIGTLPFLIGGGAMAGAICGSVINHLLKIYCLTRP